MALHALRTVEQEENAEEALLDRVFFALSDPVRRAILLRLGEEVLLVSELAAPFDISLQAVSRHIQVLVRAGLVRQERSGRISRCSLDAGPIFSAALWLNRYSIYWQRAVRSARRFDSGDRRTQATQAPQEGGQTMMTTIIRLFRTTRGSRRANSSSPRRRSSTACATN